MSIRLLRREGRQLIRSAEISPYRVTLLYLLLLYSVMIAYNVFSIVYAYSIVESAGGFDSVGRMGRYYTFSMVSPLVVSLFTALFDAAYTGYFVALKRDPSSGFRTLLSSLNHLGRVLWLCVLIAVYTALWSMLFVIPGLVAIYRYRLAFHVLFHDRTLTASQALEESKRLTYGHKLTLFRLDLSFLYYFILIYSCNFLINIPYFFELANSSMRTDLLFYFAGTAFVIVVQALFLPHLRASQTAAYFSLLSENAEQDLPL